MTIHDLIHEKCQAFSADIAALVQEALFDAFRRPGTPTRAKPGRPPGKQAPKRTAEELDALAERFHEQVRSNPGHRIEVLAEAMEVSTRDLVLPVKKLIAAKRLTTKGQKRATRYWAK